MVHDIHNCGVKGGRELVYIDMEGMWKLHKYDLSGVYMYGVLAGSILGVSLLVCGVVSDVVMAGGGVMQRSAWASVWTS
jgi:hypothetical protein